MIVRPLHCTADALKNTATLLGAGVGDTVNVPVGGVGTAIVTAVVFDAAAPRGSVTVSLTWKMLELRNWCVVVSPTAEVPSPKSHS